MYQIVEDTMTNNKIKFVYLYIISVIFIPVFAAEEESISINKPVMRDQQQPWAHFSTDYVRCFCNLPACVSTGYMCKSSGGGCFSDLLDHSGMPRTAVYRGRHGCLEFLTETQSNRCQKYGENDGKILLRKKEHPRSLLLCCHHDMCNHVDSPQTKNLFNNTLLGDTPDDTDNRYQQQQEEPFLYSNSEVWFRAATIAVPICGAVILFALIALAVKILKSENQNSISHKLGPTLYVHNMPSQSKNSHEKYYEHFDNLLRKPYFPTHHQNTLYPIQNDDIQRQFQVPLLVPSDNMSSYQSGNKNETNAKLNLMHCDLDSSKSIILEIEKESPKCSDVNIVKKNSDSGTDDKFCKDKSFIS